MKEWTADFPMYYSISFLLIKSDYRPQNNNKTYFRDKHISSIYEGTYSDKLTGEWM